MLPVLVIAHQWRSSLGTLVATIPLSWCCGSCHGHLLVLHTHACTHQRRKHLAVVAVEGFSTFFVGLLLLDVRRLALATGGGCGSCLLLFVVLLLLTFLPFPLFLVFPLPSFAFLVTTCCLALHHLGWLGGCCLGALGNRRGWCFGLLHWLRLFNIREFLLATFLLILIARYV